MIVNYAVDEKLAHDNQVFVFSFLLTLFYFCESIVNQRISFMNRGDPHTNDYHHVFQIVRIITITAGIDTK